MGGGHSSSGETVIRYAPYVEAHHQQFLDSMENQTNIAIGNNPYNDYSEIPVDIGFFGTGYTLANYPSIYDMYGKFIAGLNIEALWTELFEDTVNGPEVGALVQAESAFLRDELDTDILPRFMTGLRDINAVNSSTFIIGRGLLEDTRQKAVAKISAELRYKLIGIAQDRHKSHLAWNSGVIGSYLEVMKHYFVIKEAYIEMDYKFYDAKDRWPLEMLDYERAGLGALQGARKTTSSSGGPSQGAKVLGGALSGAAAGAYVGGPWGAVIGGVVGGLAGLLS